MKKVFAAILLTVGSVAFANSNMSWEEIYRRGWWPQFPQVQFQSSFVGVNGVCVAGDNLKATISVCDQYRSAGEGSQECVRYSERAVVQSRVQTRAVCTEYSGGDNAECRRYETVTWSTPLTYMVQVVNMQGESQSYLFSKSFTIPACH
jgi:hypothetical protein